MRKYKGFHKFEHIYYEYRSSMYQTAYTILKDSELAEDAVHTSFERIIKSRCRIEERNRTKTTSLLNTVCRNVCYDMLRKDKKEIDFLNAIDETHKNNTEELVMNKENLNRLLECINNLKPIYRDVMMMRFYQDYNYREIADILGITEEAVRKRIERGRSELKKMLEKEAMKDEI